MVGEAAVIDNGAVIDDGAVIDERGVPRTRASLAADLRALGLRPASTVLVHSSLSSLGWVCGGPVAVVQALLDVLGPAGTLVVPTQSGSLSDPATWSAPPVPSSWWPVIRDSMPAYDADLTPTRGMGAVADVVRHLPGARRSAHPTVSFTAVGPLAVGLMTPHTLAAGLGNRSPLGRLAESGAWTLLLGVGWDCATCLHLAEHRSGVRPLVRDGAPVLVDGARRWVEYDVLDYDTDRFGEIGAALEAAGRVTVGTVGSATARLTPIADAVAFATPLVTGPPTATAGAPATS